VRATGVQKSSAAFILSRRNQRTSRSRRSRFGVRRLAAAFDVAPAPAGLEPERRVAHLRRLRRVVGRLDRRRKQACALQGALCAQQGFRSRLPPLLCRAATSEHSARGEAALECGGLPPPSIPRLFHLERSRRGHALISGASGALSVAWTEGASKLAHSRARCARKRAQKSSAAFTLSRRNHRTFRSRRSRFGVRRLAAAFEVTPAPAGLEPKRRVAHLTRLRRVVGRLDRRPKQA
jgi:hypothetical protein